MEGKEAIIERIISDATIKAQTLIDDANKEASLRISSAEEWADNYKRAQEEILARDVKDIAFRRATVAELDVRKLLLQAKQQVIAEVLDNVYKKLCALDKKSYLSYVEKLISENADNGDEILFGKDNVLSEKDILDLKVVSAKNLTVSKEQGDFIGGIVLIGKICDKDLSFKTLVDNKKDEYTARIAEKLFV